MSNIGKFLLNKIKHPVSSAGEILTITGLVKKELAIPGIALK